MFGDELARRKVNHALSSAGALLALVGEHDGEEGVHSAYTESALLQGVVLHMEMSVNFYLVELGCGSLGAEGQIALIESTAEVVPEVVSDSLREVQGLLATPGSCLWVLQGWVKKLRSLASANKPIGNPIFASDKDEPSNIIVSSPFSEGNIPPFEVKAIGGVLSEIKRLIATQRERANEF